tara:strand:+ start:1548 stop:2333 length:786 start_codon:yes stop_codon:yes gene_type:complete
MGDTPQAVMVLVHLFVENTVYVPGPAFIRFIPGFPGEQPDPARYPGYELKLTGNGPGYHAIGEPQIEKQSVVHRVERFLFTNDTISVSTIRDKVQTRTGVDVAALTMLHWDKSRGQQSPKGFFPPGVECDRLHYRLSSTAELAFVKSAPNVTLRVKGPSAVVYADAHRNYNEPTTDVVVQWTSTIANVNQAVVSALGLDTSDLDRYGLVLSDYNFMAMDRVLSDNESLLVTHFTDGSMATRGGDLTRYNWFQHLYIFLVHQ